jgi:nucleotide-binding universal stress UspA family protein
MISNIIFYLNDEEKSSRAMTEAIHLAKNLPGVLTGLCVIDTELQKYADEIYAVGRLEYRDHMERELRKESEEMIRTFRSKTEEAGVECRVVLRRGMPEEEILKEISENPYDLIVLRDKHVRSAYGGVKSSRLAKKIFHSAGISALFVR